MKAQKITYWLTTSLLSLWMLANAYAYLTAEEAKILCAHFGFPGYFRVELAIAKIIGVVVLLLPTLNGRPKEWAYAGFTITVVSGFIAHLASGDPVGRSAPVLLALLLLALSYANYCGLEAASGASCGRLAT